MGAPGATELLIFLILMTAAGMVVLLVAAGRRRNSRNAVTKQGSGDVNGGARQVLDERYARGELGREEYRQMRRDMESRGGLDIVRRQFRRNLCHRPRLAHVNLTDSSASFCDQIGYRRWNSGCIRKEKRRSRRWKRAEDLGQVVR